MLRQLAIWLLLPFLWKSGQALAQLTPERYWNAALEAKDLELPVAPSSLASADSPRLALYKPDGPGPFPALVLLHQCGGLRNSSGSWQNMSMLNWARQAVGRGYVVLLLDSFGPRGVDTTCFGPKGGVNFARGLKDVLLAATHLRQLDFIDKKRVALAGYSWGAGVAVMASSKRAASALRMSDRYDAVVSFYPPCYLVPANGSPPFTLVLDGIDRPLLVLLAERDNETPPEECVSRLNPQKAAGAPIEWHTYPAATHCWDCANLHGRRKVDARGNTVEYLYDESATADSAQRMFGFIEKAFGSRP